MWGLRILGLTLLVHCVIGGIGSMLFPGPPAYASATPDPTPEDLTASARHARCLDQEKRDDLARAAVMQKVAPRLIGTDKLSRGKGYITLEQWLATDERTFDRLCSALLGLDDKTKDDSGDGTWSTLLQTIAAVVFGSAGTLFVSSWQGRKALGKELRTASNHFHHAFSVYLRGWETTGFTDADALADARSQLRNKLGDVQDAKPHWRRPRQLLELLDAPALEEGDNALWTEQTQDERHRHATEMRDRLEMFRRDVDKLGIALQHPRPLSFRRSAASYQAALRDGLLKAAPTDPAA